MFVIKEHTGFRKKFSAEEHHINGSCEFWKKSFIMMEILAIIMVMSQKAHHKDPTNRINIDRPWVYIITTGLFLLMEEIFEELKWDDKSLNISSNTFDQSTDDDDEQF